ncbi:hypothetical protein MBLNU230_g4198t1 [Neophaeotheca triangularis]
MSRGGRGGRGGGGAGRGGLSNGGVGITMDDADDFQKLMDSYNSKDDEGDFPNVTVVPPKPPTKSELRAVELQQLIKKGIRESPYYFNIDDNIKADAKGKRKPAAAVYDPFEDAPTFGNKHGKVQKKGLPSLKSMQAEMQKGGFIDKTFFPKELQDVVDPAQLAEEEEEVRQYAAREAREKQKAARRKRVDAMGEDDEGGEDADKMLDAMDQGSDTGNKSDADEDNAEGEKETDFEDDEDEQDDYNAENYFDDDMKDEAGGDDGDDAGGGGDDY